MYQAQATISTASRAWPNDILGAAKARTAGIITAARLRQTPSFVAHRLLSLTIRFLSDSVWVLVYDYL